MFRIGYLSHSGNISVFDEKECIDELVWCVNDIITNGARVAVVTRDAVGLTVDDFTQEYWQHINGKPLTECADDTPFGAM